MAEQGVRRRLSAIAVAASILAVAAAAAVVAGVAWPSAVPADFEAFARQVRRGRLLEAIFAYAGVLAVLLGVCALFAHVSRRKSRLQEQSSHQQSALNEKDGGD